MPDRTDHLTEDLRLCRRGDEDAARRLYAQAARPMEMLAGGITGDQSLAQDAAQSALLRFMRTPVDAVDRVDAALPWLLAITRNAAINLVRTESRRTKRERAYVPAAPEANAADERLRQAIGALRTEHREVIILRHCIGLTWEQIGAALGITDRGASTRHKAAVDALHARMSTNTPNIAEQHHA